MSGLDQKTAQQMLAGTAAELYGFDLDKLRPLADKVGPKVSEVAKPLTELPEGANQALKRSHEMLVDA
jgi:hypothetical protein